MKVILSNATANELRNALVAHDKPARYLRSSVNTVASDPLVASAKNLGELAEVWEYPNGDVTINYLGRSPMQPGQAKWIGRNAT